MACPHAWLWQDATLADVELIILSTEDEVVGTQQLHSTVIGGASPAYFRAQVNRLTQQAQEDFAEPDLGKQQQSDRPTKRARLTAKQQIRPTTAFIKTLEITLHPGEPQTVPEAVLCHVYTGALPDDPEQLIWMLWRADYLDLAATVTACVTKLQSLADNKQLTLQHAIQLRSLPPLQTATGAEQPHTNITAAILPRVLPAAANILQQPALLDQFTQLPLPLLKQWVQSSALQYDSANTLAVLFTAWYDAQPTPHTEEQCQELSTLLPLSSLTLCYHLQVLPRLKWWSQSRIDTGLVHALSLICPNHSKTQKRWGELSKVDTPHAPTTAATYTRTHTYTDLQQLWDKKRLDLDAVVAMGYQWTPYLELKRGQFDPSSTNRYSEEEDGWTLELLCDLHWHPVIASHVFNAGRDTPDFAAHVRVTGELEQWWEREHYDRGAPRSCSKSHCGYWGCGGYGWRGFFNNRLFESLEDLAPSRNTTFTVEFTWERIQGSD